LSKLVDDAANGLNVRGRGEQLVAAAKYFFCMHLRRTKRPAINSPISARNKIHTQWDAYTTLTLAYPNGALYRNSFGVLAQAGGRASCEFKLASWLPPELIGLSFVHSFAVLDTQSAELRFVGGVVHTKVTP
jgi:hypothetical protein